jgi:hypothetical protein
MISTFKGVVKRQHHVYTHNKVDYLTTSPLERGAIAKIARDIHVPEQTLRDWHHSRLADPSWLPLAHGHPRARAIDLQCEAAIADFLIEN